MRVQMLRTLGTARGALNAGSERDLPEALARAWAQKGLCKILEPEQDRSVAASMTEEEVPSRTQTWAPRRNRGRPRRR